MARNLLMRPTMETKDELKLKLMETMCALLVRFPDGGAVIVDAFESLIAAGAEYRPELANLH